MATGKRAGTGLCVQGKQFPPQDVPPNKDVPNPDLPPDEDGA